MFDTINHYLTPSAYCCAQHRLCEYISLIITETCQFISSSLDISLWLLHQCYTHWNKPVDKLTIWCHSLQGFHSWFNFHSCHCCTSTSFRQNKLNCVQESIQHTQLCLRSTYVRQWACLHSPCVFNRPDNQWHWAIHKYTHLPNIWPHICHHSLFCTTALQECQLSLWCAASHRVRCRHVGMLCACGLTSAGLSCPSTS